MLELKSEYDCCGCTACASICNHNAIMMIKDEKGFIYPQINPDKCKNCSLCEKVCPIIHYDTLKDIKYKTPLVFALHNNNKNIWESSSSGGAFAEFVTQTLQSNGIAYGAIFDENFNVIHQKQKMNLKL